MFHHFDNWRCSGTRKKLNTWVLQQIIHVSRSKILAWFSERVWLAKISLTKIILNKCLSRCMPLDQPKKRCTQWFKANQNQVRSKIWYKFKRRRRWNCSDTSLITCVMLKALPLWVSGFFIFAITTAGFWRWASLLKKLSSSLKIMQK